MTGAILAWERHWDGAGWGPPWWGLGFLVVLLAAGVLTFLVLRRRPAREQGSARQDAEQVLAARFARGDVDEEEYLARLAVLRESRPDK